MGNDAICLEKQGECGAMADAMPVASVAGGDSLIDGLSDKVDMLESKVNQLGDKFDVWQKLVESILGTAQASIQYDNFILAAAITVLTVGGLWAFKSKRDAVRDVTKEINESIAKGVLPEGSRLRSKIIGSIINTDEFKEQVVSILDKYSTFSSKSSYENIDKTSKVRLDSENPEKDEEDSNTNKEG